MWRHFISFHDRPEYCCSSGLATVPNAPCVKMTAPLLINLVGHMMQHSYSCASRSESQRAMVLSTSSQSPTSGKFSLFTDLTLDTIDRQPLNLNVCNDDIEHQGPQPAACLLSCVNPAKQLHHRRCPNNPKNYLRRASGTKLQL